MVSVVGVVTAVTSSITGAVVSVVVVVVSSVVVCSSFSPQEKMMKLKRKRERTMSICLIGFLID